VETPLSIALSAVWFWFVWKLSGGLADIRWTWYDVAFGVAAGPSLGFLMGSYVWGQGGAFPMAALTLALGASAFVVGIRRNTAEEQG